jgi:hypothetical protein
VWNNSDIIVNTIIKCNKVLKSVSAYDKMSSTLTNPEKSTKASDISKVQGFKKNREEA